MAVAVLHTSLSVEVTSTHGSNRASAEDWVGSLARSCYSMVRNTVVVGVMRLYTHLGPCTSAAAAASASACPLDHTDDQGTYANGAHASPIVSQYPSRAQR